MFNIWFGTEQKITQYGAQAISIEMKTTTVTTQDDKDRADPSYKRFSAESDNAAEQFTTLKNKLCTTYFKYMYFIICTSL